MQSMKTRHVVSIVAGLLVFADSSLGTVGLNAPPQATPIHHYGAEYGAITTALTSPDNVTIQIVTVQRGTNEWLFHIHAHNNGQQSVSVMDAATSHYFVIGGKGGIPGTPYTFGQLTVRLTPPEQAVAETHPAFSSLIEGGADIDGWLVADLSTFKYSPFQLLYVYGTVTAPACTNPDDQSTCHSSTGYRTIVWNL